MDQTLLLLQVKGFVHETIDGDYSVRCIGLYTFISNLLKVE